MCTIRAMLGSLEAAIEDLDVDGLSGELVEGFALLDRLNAKLTLAAAFDHDKGWELDAAGSMTSWLRTHAARSHTDAPRIRATGRRLRSLPGTATAWTDGVLSSAQVATVTANVKDRTAELFVEAESWMLPALAACNEAQAARAMREWAQRANALRPESDPKPEPPRSLHHSEHLDGRSYLSADLDPEATAIVATILRLFHRPNRDGETRTPAERRADALTDALRFTLDHQDTQSGGRHRPHLNVIVNYDNVFGEGTGGGYTLDGTPIDQTTLRRMLCDAAIHRLVTDGHGVILDFGTATRTISPALWTTIVLRDEHCTFPGCDIPAERCDAHHLEHVEDGGPTNPANVELRCWHHHHLVHQPGWHEKLLPDGTLKITAPDGRVFTRPPPR
jgi:hypothetical protein